MSRQNLNRRHLNFLDRQRLARARRLQETARALRRRTRETVEARRVASVRAAATRRSEAGPQGAQPTPIQNSRAPALFDAAAALPSASQLSETPTVLSKPQNILLRQELSEKVRQFLMTLSLKRQDNRKQDNRDIDYIAAWNETLSGLGLTPERLAAFRETPPEREALVEVILESQGAKSCQPNGGAPL